MFKKNDKRILFFLQKTDTETNSKSLKTEKENEESKLGWKWLSFSSQDPPS